TCFSDLRKIFRNTLDFIFSQKYKRTKNRFLTLHYANNNRYNAPYHQFKEWSKESVKTRTTRSRTIENKRLRKTSSLEQHEEACFD
ncbi:hypothetical protein T06_1981, partial [Trichinella sp. T6]